MVSFTKRVLKTCKYINRRLIAIQKIVTQIFHFLYFEHGYLIYFKWFIHQILTRGTKHQYHLFFNESRFPPTGFEQLV